MSPTPSLHRCRATLCLGVALLTSPAHPAPNDKPKQPPSVQSSQQQHARWVAAFNAWRTATSTWSGETEEEVKLRGETRLLLLPTPRPVLARQRWLGGRAIVVSSGLIALLDEMLLAEAASGVRDPASIARHGDCFTAYGARVLQSVDLNRDAQASRPLEPLSAWPRLSTLVEAGKSRTIGETYDTDEGRKTRKASHQQKVELALERGTQVPPEVDETAGPCKAVTPALLRSSATRARVADDADALALWLFTQQSLQLARLPSLARPKTPGPAADERTRPPNAADSAPPDACARLPTPAASAASSPTAAIPAPKASSAQRARQAVCATGRLREPRTAEWLGRYMTLFDAGSSPSSESP